MALDITWSPVFEVDENGVSQLTGIKATVNDNDGLARIKVLGLNKRVWEFDATVSEHTRTLKLLGFAEVPETISGLFYQGEGRRRVPVVVDPDTFLPGQVTSATISAWSSSTGFTLTAITPPASPATIAGYRIRADLDPAWSAFVNEEESFAFNPSVFSAWVEGVATFDVDFTIEAVTEAGNAGPPSAPITKTINQTDVFFVPDEDITVTSVVDEGPEGVIEVEFLGTSGFVPVSPWTSRMFVGALPDGADPVTMLPFTWVNDANTFAIAPGDDPIRIPTGVAAAGDAYAIHVLRSNTSGRYIMAGAVRIVEVLPLTLDPPLPTLVSGPTIDGLVNNRAHIGVQLTGSAEWDNTNANPPPARRDRFQVEAIGVGTVSTTGSVNYTPVADDNRKGIRVRSSGFRDGQEVFAVSPTFPVVYAAPVASGTGITNRNYTTGSGNQTISAVDVAAAFTGTIESYAISSSVASINTSTGEITFPTDADITEVVTVFASNSGGQAEVSFTVAVADGLPAFPSAIPENLWTSAEIREEPEAGGVTGRRKATLSTAAVLPTGFTLHIYQGTEPGGPANVASIATITPGATFSTTSGLAVGSVVYPRLIYQRTADGATQTASVRPSFAILGIGGSSGVVWPAFPAASLTHAINIQNTTFSNAGSNNAFTGLSMVVEAAEAYRGNEAAYNPTLRQMRSALGSSVCISVCGGFAGQMHLRFGTAAVLAKNTPVLWDGVGVPAGMDPPFTAAEKTKIDLLVRALGLSGAYMCSTKNPDIAAGIAKARNFLSEPNWWSTNYNFSGYGPAAVHIARAFLGATTLKNFLNNLSVATFAGQLNTNSLGNAYNVLNGLPNTGSGAFRGGESNPKPSKVQVQNAVANWVCATPNFEGQTIDSSHASVISAINRMFSRIIESGVGGTSGNNWIGPGITWNEQQWAKIAQDATSVPNRGQEGMAQEFRSSDANGTRSALTPYVIWGLRVFYDHMTACAVAGLINRGDSAFQTAVARAHRGVLDIDIKSQKGYRNFEKGKGHDYVETDEGVTWTMRTSPSGGRVRSYTLTHWFDVLYPWATQ